MNPTDIHTRSPRYWLMKSEPQECSIDDTLAALATAAAGR